MDRNVYLRIGEAARLAGVSVQTLRRWESEGVLEAARTAGGQRTYRLSDIERLHDQAVVPLERAAPHSPPEVPEAPAGVDERSRIDRIVTHTIHPWEARQANAAADLAVTRLELERLEEMRKFRLSRDREERGAAEVRNRAEYEKRLAEERAKERKQQEAALALTTSKIRMSLGLGDNPERAEIEQLLADHATPGVSLRWLEAEAAVISDRHAARRTRERTERDAAERRKFKEQMDATSSSIRRELLIAHGVASATALTSNRDEWDSEAARDALNEVRQLLRDRVRSDWTERRTEDEVDDILADWE